ncbi:MAG: diaminobutyrate acetyltransferase [Oceanospirillaceae bacterium]|nr:diaminobutyrate acetyltransferase [Oceanospirillaceae bacterium]|tara:strand:- start:402 stop:944 length:543 start_codon:yes stop_codon:yes gene_type:complete
MDTFSTETSEKNITDQNNITFRKPAATDGHAVFSLVERCKPLDVNSMYCNLLQCSHFADTAIVAEQNGEMVGFISGYRLPHQPDTLFVWQVAVDSKARGQGLASRMLHALLKRHQHVVHHLHTSITPGNDASWNTFRRLAHSLGAPLQTSELFDREQHFGGAHDSETLVHIGPFMLFAQE